MLTGYAGFINILLLLIFKNVDGYFVDEHSYCTNVEGAIDPPTAFVTYLGKFNSTKQCIQACIDKNCESYSYYYLNNANNSGACWSYLNETIWLPYPTKTSDCGRIIYPCKDNTDCSLNGICDTNGNCTCNKGWNGYKCHFLSLLPANKSAGYLAPFGSTNSTSWGGSVAFDKTKKKYVMTVAEMEYNCGINSWRRNSEIVFAETMDDNWNSQYIAKGVIMVPFAHSPDIIYAPDTDEFVLFHVVNTSWNEHPPCMNCTDGSTPPGCGPQNVTETTAFMTIAAADLSNGYDPKKWSEPVDIETVGHGDSNFAAVINKDSSLVGMIRGHVVTASNWKDNTTYKVQQENMFPYVLGTEDMFVYKDCNGLYHALFHNMDPHDDQALCGAHAYSTNGVNWIYGGLAFGNSVEFDDNTKFVFRRRERPHLIFDNDGCTPIALTSAAEYGGKYGDKSYTLLQPINH